MLTCNKKNWCRDFTKNKKKKNRWLDMQFLITARLYNFVFMQIRLLSNLAVNELIAAIVDWNEWYLCNKLSTVFFKFIYFLLLQAILQGSHVDYCSGGGEKTQAKKKIVIFLFIVLLLNHFVRKISVIYDVMNLWVRKNLAFRETKRYIFLYQLWKEMRPERFEINQKNRISSFSALLFILRHRSINGLLNICLSFIPFVTPNKIGCLYCLSWRQYLIAKYSRM